MMSENHPLRTSVYRTGIICPECSVPLGEKSLRTGDCEGCLASLPESVMFSLCSALQENI
jgi:hypothetical protein